MTFPFPTEWPQYFTASIPNWLPLFFMIENKRIELNAFVVMDNHIHLIWQPLSGHSLSSVQLNFMKFTAQQIKFALAIDNLTLLEQCKVNKTDREYQILKRKPLSVELSSTKSIPTKIGIHTL